MHVNVYDENIGDVTPVSVKTKTKNGVTYYGVTLVLQGVHDQVTFWATSKGRLVNLFHGLEVLIEANVVQGSLETPSYNGLISATPGFARKLSN